MDNLKQLRWLIYVRKSEDDKDKQVQSNQGQVDDIQAMVKRLGRFTIVDIIQEEQSAKEPGRPKFNELIKRINKGEAQGILVWAYHRLSRNPIDDGTIQWLLQQGTIQAIKTIDRVYLPGDNALLLRIEGGTANQFILDLKKNVRRGLKQKVEKGWKPGQAPLGYLNSITEAYGENYILKDPDRFPLMRKAWDLLLSRQKTVPQILEMMNNEWGMRTRKTKRQGGRPICRSALYRMFADPFYAGLFYYGGQLYHGKQEAMITLDEFDRAQQFLGRKGNPRPQKHEFTYTGIMNCAVCGSAITATRKTKFIKSTSHLKTYVFYHCTKRKKTDVPCNQKCLPEQELETLIIKELQHCSINALLKDWAMDTIMSDFGTEETDRLKIAESQMKAVFTAEHEMNTLTSLRVRDLLSDQEYIIYKKKLQNKIVILKQKAIEARTNAVDWQQFIAGKFDFAQHAIQRFKNGSPEEKKDVLLTLGWNYTLKDKKLFIYKHRWLESIIKFNKDVDSEIQRLEPSEKSIIQEQNNDFAFARPHLLALVDEVRTQLEQEHDAESKNREGSTTNSISDKYFPLAA